MARAEEMVGCVLVGAGMVALIGSVLFVWSYLVAWLATAVFAGFGHIIPFWPTVGAVVLLQVVVGAVGAALRGRS